MPSKLVILYLNPHLAGLASLHRGGGGPRRWVKYIIYKKTFYVNIFWVFNGFLYLIKIILRLWADHSPHWVNLCASAHGAEFFFIRRSESLCRSFVTRSESLCRHSWRGVNLCAVNHDAEWIFESSFMKRSESLSHHSWSGVNLWVIIHDAEWTSAP